MDINLVPIDQIIVKASEAGATFGHGDAKTHLAYLTKLRLLPQTIRRKIDNKITGCYPKSVVATLLDIEHLKNQGLTYSQIRYELTQSPKTTIYPQQSITISPNSVAFLIIGLFLGFLLATNNAKGTPQPLATTTSTNLDADSQNLVKLVTNANSTKESPIYVIALPQQNLDKLGKTNINYLNN